ncbi:MAG: glycine zipper 2TM domain-containing protein [Comamonadaceae bacterium]|nr:MAG: glycine zipper 2TM domain-containing protein [Comamonadaceae bacterium]
METNPNQSVPVPGVVNNGPDFSQRLHHNKALVAVIAVLGVTVMALAAALMVGNSDARSGANVGMAPAQMQPTPVQSQIAANQFAATQPIPAPVTTRSNVAPAPAPRVVENNRNVVVAQNEPVQRRSDVCSTCGRVEAVTAVQRQGAVNGVPVGNTTIGLGTVAGGLVGGLLGNQVGGGNGKTAATVLGVAGGAFAGNAIEKNMKKVTVYQVRVRMDDGSSRLMDVSSNIPVGSRVVVEGKNLRMA